MTLVPYRSLCLADNGNVMKRWMVTQLVIQFWSFVGPVYRTLKYPKIHRHVFFNVIFVHFQAYCRILHARMLEVESKAENDFIAAQIRSRSGTTSVWSSSQCLSALSSKWRFIWYPLCQLLSYCPLLKPNSVVSFKCRLKTHIF